MNLYQMYFKRAVMLLSVVSAMAIFGLSVKAQTDSVDLTFNASSEVDAQNYPPTDFLVQADNKIVVFGSFQAVNGAVTGGVARFNADNSLDTTFNCAVCNFTITSAKLQPDGKIIVAGYQANAFLDNIQAVVYRLNTDGSRDLSFAQPFSPAGSGYTGSATVWQILPNGQIIVVYEVGNLGYISDTVYRINTDGTIDYSLAPFSVGGGRLVRSVPVKIVVLPNGKFLEASNFSNGISTDGSIGRYNADGTSDSTFESPDFAGTSSPPPYTNTGISDFDVAADGSIFVTGSFATVNGTARFSFVKLAPAGNVDLSFNYTGSPVGRVKALPNGKVLVSTTTLLRLNADGGVDNTFAAPANLTQVNNFMLDATGGIVVFGTFLENSVSVRKFARLNQDGVLQSSFAVTFGISGSVTAIAAQANGKVVFAGNFLRVDGTPRTSIVRVNADGSLDATFNSGIGFNGTINELAAQPDGKIIAAGITSNYNGTPINTIVRLNTDGSLDTTFTAPFTETTVYAVVLLPDGKILVGGGLNIGQTRTAIARLNSDGTIDTTFNSTFGNSPIAYSLAVQQDGKILVGGSFSGVNGFNRMNLVRLNSDGTLDSAFNPGNINIVRQVAVQPDGKVVIVENNVRRLNSDGTVDNSFQPAAFTSPSGSVFYEYQLLLQPGGKIIFGGNFTAINSSPRSKIVRFNSDGTIDNSFLPSGANNNVRALARQADGKILVGGDFSQIGGVTRLGIARLNTVIATRTPFDFDGDGRADLSVFRPSTGTWYIAQSSNNAVATQPFGTNGDSIAPADFDGDGKTDLTVFRPSTGTWYIQRSSLGFTAINFGASGDLPVPGDYDGDGKADIAVYRPSNNYFYVLKSSDGQYYYTYFGIAGDIPTPGDYDRDGKIDIAVFRPSNGTWYRINSSTGQWSTVQFGQSGDLVVPADYDADGFTDIAVFRPSNGTWYLQRTTAGFTAIQFGANGDKPAPADYDGDGRIDLAVFRPSNGVWYLNRSTSGFAAIQFGISEDLPAPNAYIR